MQRIKGTVHYNSWKVRMKRDISLYFDQLNVTMTCAINTTESKSFFEMSFGLKYVSKLERIGMGGDGKSHAACEGNQCEADVMQPSHQ